MMESQTDPSIRRILVALDAATHSRTALQSVAELAARLRADVDGLFVEDVNLLRSAELPVVRQVSLPTGLDTEFDSVGVERDLRAMAWQAEQDLAQAAERAHVKWSFRVVRGQMAEEVVSAAQAADLVVVENACRPMTRHISLDAPARQAVGQAQCSTLYLRPGAWLQHPMVVAYDGTQKTVSALRVAAKMAEGGSAELGILVHVEGVDAWGQMQERVKQVLAGRELKLRWHQLPSKGAAGLCSTVREMRTGVLVIAFDDELFQGDDSSRLLETLPCPVLLVR